MKSHVPSAAAPAAPTGQFRTMSTGALVDMDVLVRKLLLHPAVPSGLDEWFLLAELVGWDDQLRAKAGVREAPQQQG